MINKIIDKIELIYTRSDKTIFTYRCCVIAAIVILYLKYDLINIIQSLLNKNNYFQNNNIKLVKNVTIITIPIILVGLFIFKNYQNMN